MSGDQRRPVGAAVPGFARNALTSFGVRALLALSVLLLTPYLFRTLGAAGFGTWSVLFTLVTVAGLAESGLTLAVVKLVAEERGRNGHPGEIVGAAVALLALLGLLAAALLVAGAFTLTGLAADGQGREFTLGMLALAVGVALRTPLAAYCAVLRGVQRYDLSNRAAAFSAVAFAVAAVPVLELGGGIVGLCVAYGASLVAGGLLGLVLLLRVEPGLRLRPQAHDATAARRIVGFGSYTLLADSMGFIAARMDVVVIAAIRNAAAAAPFAAALKLQSGMQALILPWVNVLMPLQAELWGAGERAKVAERLTLATRVAAQVTIPVGLALVLFADDLVHAWLGSDAPAITAAIVVLLLTVQIATLTSAPAEKVLIAVGRARAIGRLATVEGLANLGLSVVLVSRYGAVGAAIGTLLTTAALAPVKLPLAARAVGMSLRPLLVGGVGAAVASSLPSIAGMVALRLLLDPGLTRLTVGAAVGLVLAAAVAGRQLGAARIRATAAEMLGKQAKVRISPSLGTEAR